MRTAAALGYPALGVARSATAAALASPLPLLCCLAAEGAPPQIQAQRYPLAEGPCRVQVGRGTIVGEQNLKMA